jgi:hypothetical protein
VQPRRLVKGSKGDFSNSQSLWVITCICPLAAWNLAVGKISYERLIPREGRRSGKVSASFSPTGYLGKVSNFRRALSWP